MMVNLNIKSHRWLKLGLTLVVYLAFGIGLGFLAQSLLVHYHISEALPAWLALLTITGILLVVNVSVLPIPFGISIMFVAAQHWNPVLVALCGSVGASLGEFSSYFFGYLGHKVSIDENTPGYKMIKQWIEKHGMWAIALLSFQPILPFELGGFIAGLSKMPIRQFLPAIWIGKFPKYLILIYLGSTLMHLYHHIHF